MEKRTQKNECGRVLGAEFQFVSTSMVFIFEIIWVKRFVFIVFFGDFRKLQSLFYFQAIQIPVITAEPTSISNSFVFMFFGFLQKIVDFIKFCFNGSDFLCRFYARIFIVLSIII